MTEHKDMLGQHAIIKLIDENERLHALVSILLAALEGAITCMETYQPIQGSYTDQIIRMCKRAMQKAEVKP